MISLRSHSYVVGTGNAEIGVSQDKETANFGMAGNYSLLHSNSTSTSKLASRMQLGSHQGRSLISTAAHQYQYEQSFIQTELDNSNDFYYPGLSWNNKFNHSIDFIDQETDPTLNSDINYSDTESSYTLSTGLLFEYDRGRLFDYQIATNLLYSEISGDSSSENNLVIRLMKDISPVTSINLDITNMCVDFQDAIVKDFCRSELLVGAYSNRVFTSYSLELGISHQDQIETNIYTVRAGHRLNSYSFINVSLEKTISETSENTQIDKNNINTLEHYIKEIKSLSYLYEWGRKRFEIKARNHSSKTFNEVFTTKDLSFFYRYQLGSSLCHACSMGMSYEYYGYGKEKDQNIISLLVNKKHSRRISSTYSIRKTQMNDDLDVWSINMLMSYKGNLTKLGKR